jgi:hypothetical protein
LTISKPIYLIKGSNMLPPIQNIFFVIFTILLLAGRGGGGSDSPNLPVTSVPVVPQDSDNDGVVDNLDSCSATPAGAAVDSTGCAIPLDTDIDGVLDDIDVCPATPVRTAVDSVGCAVPLDSDNDGGVG